MEAINLMNHLKRQGSFANFLFSNSRYFTHLKALWLYKLLITTLNELRRANLSINNGGLTSNLINLEFSLSAIFTFLSKTKWPSEIQF